MIQTINNKKKYKRWAFLSIALFFILISAISLMQTGTVFGLFQKERVEIAPPIQFVQKFTPALADVDDENNDIEKVVTLDNRKEAFQSESYQMRHMSVGGDLMILAGAQEQQKLEIFNVESEVFVDAEKQKMKLLLTWKTNKPAMYDVAYGRMNSAQKEAINNERFGLVHGAVLSELVPDTTYTYNIIATDQWGNMVQSEQYVAYTGLLEASVFDMISTALNDVFGWALSK